MPAIFMGGAGALVSMLHTRQQGIGWAETIGASVLEGIAASLEAGADRFATAQAQEMARMAAARAHDEAARTKQGQGLVVEVTRLAARTIQASGTRRSRRGIEQFEVRCDDDDDNTKARTIDAEFEVLAHDEEDEDSPL